MWHLAAEMASPITAEALSFLSWAQIPGMKPFPRLHTVVVCKFATAGIAGNFFLGPCLATESTSPPFLGFLMVSCCSFTASLSYEPFGLIMG